MNCCGRCGREVYCSEQKFAIGKVWHAFCFSCYKCRKLLDNCSVYSFCGELFCCSCYYSCCCPPCGTCPKPCLPPCKPCGPCGPCGPCDPCNPCNPCAPCAPCPKPCDPCCSPCVPSCDPCCPSPCDPCCSPCCPPACVPCDPCCDPCPIPCNPCDPCNPCCTPVPCRPCGSPCCTCCGKQVIEPCVPTENYRLRKTPTGTKCEPVTLCLECCESPTLANRCRSCSPRTKCGCRKC